MMRINRDEIPLQEREQKIIIVSKEKYDLAMKAYRNGEKGFSMYNNDLYFNTPLGRSKLVISKQ